MSSMCANITAKCVSVAEVFLCNTLNPLLSLKNAAFLQKMWLVIHCVCNKYYFPSIFFFSGLSFQKKPNLEHSLIGLSQNISLIKFEKENMTKNILLQLGPCRNWIVQVVWDVSPLISLSQKSETILGLGASWHYRLNTWVLLYPLSPKLPCLVFDQELIKLVWMRGKASSKTTQTVL